MDEELLADECVVAANEEGAPARVEASKNKHQVEVALWKSAMKFYLGIVE